MKINIHPHAEERMKERGATRTEIVTTVKEGERFPAKFGRTGFRRNFSFDGEWQGQKYASKQLEVYAVQEGQQDKEWLVITIIVKYF